MTTNPEGAKPPEQGRFLNAVAQIRLAGEPLDAVVWAALPLYEGQLELALTWMRNNHATLVRMLDAAS